MVIQQSPVEGTTLLAASKPGFNVEALAGLSQRLQDPEWVAQRRRAAWARYQQIPMPTRTDEAWRRTDLSSLDLQSYLPFTPVPRSATALAALPARLRRALDLGGPRGGLVVQHNSESVYRELDATWAGRGVIFTSLEQAVRDHPELVQQHFGTAVPTDYWKFSALNEAFWSGGVFLYVPRNVVVAVPLVSWLWASEPGLATVSRVLIVAEAGSQVCFVDQYASPEGRGAGLHLGAVEIVARPGAQVTYLALQEWDHDTWDLTAQRLLGLRDSTTNLINVGFGGKVVRVNQEAILREQGAHAFLYGVYFPDGTQHIDFHTLQDHQAPNTTSDLLFKGVLRDQARAIYEGLVWVRKEAKGTNANQTNRSILLSHTSKADSVPMLQIETAEIQRCSHHATVGRVDENQLFYLMARGLTRGDATRLLLEGFFQEVVGHIPEEAIREHLRQVIERKLSAP